MKKFFQKIGAFFQKFFGGVKKFEQFLKDHIDDAIGIVAQIQLLINNPATITLLAVLPPKYSEVAGEALFKAQTALDKVITQLNLSNECLQKETFTERLTCFIIQLRGLSPEVREGVLRQFATLYARESSGNTVKKNIINGAIESRFMDIKNGITGI